MLIDEEKIMSRWKKYFQNLLGCEDEVYTQTEDKNKNSEYLEPDNNAGITMEDLKDAITKFKN